MKPISSAITTPRRVPCSPTGERPGASGSAVAIPAGAALAGSVAENDRAAEATLALSLRWPPKAKIAGGYSDDHGYDEMITGYALPTVEFFPPADAVGALASIAAFYQPAGAQALGKGIAAMRALCSRRTDGEDDTRFLATLLLARLAEYPADVTREAMRRWTDREKWFPSWAELKAECDRLFRRRRLLREALERRASRSATPLAAPPPERATASPEGRTAA